jgi:hypothetical protein
LCMRAHAEIWVLITIVRKSDDPLRHSIQADHEGLVACLGLAE